MTLKPGKTCGRFKVTSFNAITLNPRVQLHVWKKKHSLFHWNTLMWPGPLILIWTSCKRNVSMIVGSSIRTEACQTHGKDSQSSLCWERNLQRDIVWSGGETDKNSNGLPDLTSCGLWSLVQNEESRSEERIAWMGYRNTKFDRSRKTERYFNHPSGRWWFFKRKPTKTQGKSWKFQWRRQCLPKKNKEALRVSENWNEEWWMQQDSKNNACMHRGGSRVHEKTFGIISTGKIMKITSQARGTITMTRYNLVHTFLPDAASDEIPEAKAAVDKEYKKKLETIPAWQLDKVKSKKEVFPRSTKRQKRESTFLHWWTSVNSKNAELEP